MNDKLPNIFIVAGMPRSGTTFLYHNFQKHPYLYATPVKETNYFSSNYKKGIEWFTNLFRGMRDYQIGCDVSPLYFLDPLSVQRISDSDKDIKVILSIRDPVEFAVSLYNNCSTFIWKMPSFEEFIESFRLKKGQDYIHFRLTRESSLSILNNFRKAFGDKLLFYDYDFFKNNPLKVLQLIERFLGIPPFFTEQNYDSSIINPTKEKKFKILSYLSNNEILISLLNRITPSHLFTMIRRTFYKLDLRTVHTKVINQEDNHYKLSEEFFSIDRTAIRDLFCEHDVFLGSGEPFEIASGKL